MNNTNENARLDKTVINWYPGLMAKTKRLIKENLDLIDVVYEVIDARIPKSSKIIDIDDLIKNKEKIIIMTKIDLCDKKETNKWIKYYESLGYHVFSTDLEHNFKKSELLKITNEIIQEKNKKRLQKGMIKRKTRVLIIGIPNVGKSTLINKLVGKKVVNTGNKPGITKNLNWIRIDEDIELLDTPGILWPKLEQEKEALNLASLTAIKEEILPIDKVVCYILDMLNIYYKDILNSRYKIELETEDPVEILELIGKKRGCLIKGGEIDYQKVENIIMNDVKSGVISNITFDRFDNEG